MPSPLPPKGSNPFGRPALERYVFVHKDGTCFEVSDHKATAEGTVLYDEAHAPFGTVSADEFAAILPLKPDEILDQDSLPERSRIALAMVKIEQAIAEWIDYRAKSGQRIYRLPAVGEIVIFGSASLNITLLPQRVSHDFDVATDERFWIILRERLREMSADPADLTLVVHTDNLFRHSGNWRSRSLPIRGHTELEFLVAHPLDTISQKLLRSDPLVFEQKDLPDIERTLKILRPPPSIIRSLLQEGYTRFFDDLPEIADAARRNTALFFNAFYPDLDIDRDIIAPGRQRRRQGYETTDLLVRPLPKDWRDLLKNEPLL